METLKPYLYDQFQTKCINIAGGSINFDKKQSFMTVKFKVTGIGITLFEKESDKQ